MLSGPNAIVYFGSRAISDDMKSDKPPELMCRSAG